MVKRSIALAKHWTYWGELVAWDILVFVLALVTYTTIDFDTHFTSDKSVTFPGKVYYTLMNHTAVGCNDIVPKTDFARALTGLHVLLSWCVVMFFIA
jgi:hypothetical protein